VITRVFLLSPAMCRGPRASLLTAPRSNFTLAARLRAPDGASLGEVFTFLSGLYFRGKLAYGRAFARPPVGYGGGVFVITPHLGLQPPEMSLTMDGLRAAARVDIRSDNRRYRQPLDASATALAELLGPDAEVVLLGSIATGKYVDALLEIFGHRLTFPIEFVGRGDMSRGGLLLRCVREGRELTYVPLGPATPRHGPRPPRLPRLVTSAASSPVNGEGMMTVSAPGDGDPATSAPHPARVRRGTSRRPAAKARRATGARATAKARRTEGARAARV
jgi:hypothetical protein